MFSGNLRGQGGKMRIQQNLWTSDGWRTPLPASPEPSFQLALVFASTAQLGNSNALEDIRRVYPEAICLGCSTAGEIVDTQVYDDSIALTVVGFDRTKLRLASTKVSDGSDSFSAGQRLARQLPSQDLTHVFVLSDGLSVNGSDLAKGLSENLPSFVKVTGGLAGDGARFAETLVLVGQEVAPKTIAALGFYGTNLRIGYGSLGGWDPFGPDRLITKSEGNVLYELDGKSALDLYKEYLGEHAQGLPATGLLFPLCLRSPENPNGVVRTILAVDEATKSMTFAGDIPKGTTARLMKANFDRLIDGASGAAENSYRPLSDAGCDLAILISCVGRKLILKQRIEEEVEAVRSVLGDNAALTGFYSYGELAPFIQNARCELHNQTMTITTFSESL